MGYFGTKLESVLCVCVCVFVLLLMLILMCSVHEINAALEQKLKTLIEDTIQQSLGYPMVYTITEAVQVRLRSWM